MCATEGAKRRVWLALAALRSNGYSDRQTETDRWRIGTYSSLVTYCMLLSSSLSPSASLCFLFIWTCCFCIGEGEATSYRWYYPPSMLRMDCAKKAPPQQRQQMPLSQKQRFFFFFYLHVIVIYRMMTLCNRFRHVNRKHFFLIIAVFILKHSNSEWMSLRLTFTSNRFDALWCSLLLHVGPIHASSLALHLHPLIYAMTV